MIILDVATVDMLMLVVRDSTHPKAMEIARELKRQSIESLERELKFKNQNPALCRQQV